MIKMQDGKYCGSIYGRYKRRRSCDRRKDSIGGRKLCQRGKKIYGSKLHEIILYGSCVRGDFKEDSDIDLFVLLNVASDEISRERKRILDVADRLDLHYDVVLAPVFQSLQLYEKYGGVSVFYQTIRREGVKIA